MNLTKLHESNTALQLSKAKSRIKTYPIVSIILILFGILSLIIEIILKEILIGVLMLLFFLVLSSFYYVAYRINKRFIEKHHAENKSQMELAKDYLKKTKDAILKK